MTSRVARASVALIAVLAVLAVTGCSSGSVSTPPASVSLGTAEAPTAIAPTTAPTSFVVEAGRIAYGVKGADGSVHVASANADGSNIHQLTTGSGFQACVTYSPDRTRIAYCSDASGNFEIWTVGSDGSNQAQVTHLGGSALFPNYSPDGKLIAFGGGQINVVDATTGASLQVLTNCTGQKPGCSNDFPAWSPDGMKILYIHAEDSNANGEPVNSQIWIMDADGSHAKALTSDPASKDQLPEWSPDGLQIAYERGNGGNGGIWLMDADGSHDHQLTGCTATDPSPCAVGDDFGPAWSPDGTEIAFVRDFGALGQNDRPVYVMNADGTNQHRVIADPIVQYVPAW
ncbi:MAG: hypothetical protein ABI573_05285 [Chloroflexota bacterium]